MRGILLNMKGISNFRILMLFPFSIYANDLVAQNDLFTINKLTAKIIATKGLVAMWDFHEEAGSPKISMGSGNYSLIECNGPIPRMAEGPLSGYSIALDGKKYLKIDHGATGRLNINGKGKGITVCAWVKWTGEQTGFVGGMWNEYEDGGKRQYGLFISLPHYNGKDQVCGHISYTGKPTPPFPYSSDYSASRQKVIYDEWSFVAFTYDGSYIRSYLNGKFEKREMELINNTKGFPGYPDGMQQIKNPFYFPDGMGNNGSDFTVGAVLLKRGMGNFFKGQIGGLAIFERCLTAKEILRLNHYTLY